MVMEKKAKKGTLMDPQTSSRQWSEIEVCARRNEKAVQSPDFYEFGRLSEPALLDKAY